MGKRKTRRCPECAEDILLEAKKCKHCGSEISPEEKVEKQYHIWKLFLYAFLFFMGIALWYLSIPLLLIWFIWKKSHMERSHKIAGTGAAVVLFFVLIGLFSHINRSPEIIISQPTEIITVQDKESVIKGRVEPKAATVNINGVNVSTSEGEFTYTALLNNENNQFKVIANNNGSKSEKIITINREFTEEELAELDRIAREREEKQKAAQEARAKAEEERKAAEIAAQQEWEQSQAGQICSSHPEWAKEDCDRLADNKIWIGMTYDMLTYKRGNPDSTNPSDYGFGVEYQWCWWNYTPSCFYAGADQIITSYN